MYIQIISSLALFYATFSFAESPTPSQLPKNTASSNPSPPSPLTLSFKVETVPFFGNFRVNSYVLPNGLRILIVEDHSSPTFAYQTWYKVGSRDEEAGHTGLAHFFEHMMFKGTQSVKEGEFDQLLEEAGVEGENAFTSRDYTAYVQELPKDKLELIMKLEADRMVNLVINKTGFNTEREVVQNERRFRTENNPDGLMDEELFNLAFKRHPYHWPIIGSESDLKAMTEIDANQFYKRYYAPNRATVVIVGDVNPSQVIKLASLYYAPLSAQENPSKFIVKEPPQMAPRRKTVELNIQVEKLQLAYHIPSSKDPDMPALEVLQSVLTGSRSSRLDCALVESGIATQVNTSELDDKDPSLLIISVNLQKGQKAARAENMILREIKKLSTTLVPKEELQRVKNKMSFSYYENLLSNYDKAAFLGKYEAVEGDFKEGIQRFAQSQKTTAKEIRNMAIKYLNPRNRTVIMGVQKVNPRWSQKGKKTK